jgi:UDP-N-acetylglucosamine 2-epimerase
MADNVAPLLQGCGRIVNIGHGLLSKGQYFTDREIVLRENQSDLLCVPGSYHRDRLLASGKVTIPVAATGFPKLDALFNPAGPDRSQLMRLAGLDPQKRVVLYAPTFNMELSAIPILWMRIAELADEDTLLLIKLHGSTLPEFKQAHRELAQRHENVYYIEDLDIAPYLKLADVLVSDVSSAFMEFIALDKPIVLFNNPNVTSYVNYDPRDIEYSWRSEIGIEANSMEEVCTGVKRSFELPAEFGEARNRRAEQLLADRAGRASARVVDEAERLAGEATGAGADPEQPRPEAPAALAERMVSKIAGRMRMAQHFAQKGEPDRAIEHVHWILGEDPGNIAAQRLLETLQPQK